MANQIKTTEKKRSGFSIGQYMFIFIFLALFIVYYVVSTSLTWTGITNILRHSAVIGVISFGMGMIIITGDIDLSVGSILGCVASFACWVFNITDNVLLTVLFCLALGTVLGFLNGMMIGKFKLPAFIATLATQLIYRSVAQYFCNGLPNEIKGVAGNTFKMIQGPNRDLMYNFGNGKLLGLPTCGVIFLLIAVVLIYISTSTKYGKRLFAIGSNVKAAHMAGINVGWNRVSVFTITGLLCGIGAVMWLCMQGNVDPSTTGASYEMYAIAAVVLGNISMSGGKGKFLGIIFGTLSYTIIDKIIAAVKVDSLINNAIKGMILIVAIIIQTCGPQIKNYFASKKKAS
ncbi:MAG: ABC transporter permease [Oscillospiraceae bacterium]|nr:ABC transporter permease [Oscillospiraceae bacterium]